MYIHTHTHTMLLRKNFSNWYGSERVGHLPRSIVGKSR